MADLGLSDTWPQVWVNEDSTVMVNVWHDGSMTVAFREQCGQTWGPPITLTREARHDGVSALDVPCGRCGHELGRHGPWPFEEDRSMRCHTCWFSADGVTECDCLAYVEPSHSKEVRDA